MAAIKSVRAAGREEDGTFENETNKHFADDSDQARTHDEAAPMIAIAGICSVGRGLMKQQ